MLLLWFKASCCAADIKADCEKDPLIGAELGLSMQGLVSGKQGASSKGIQSTPVINI